MIALLYCTLGAAENPYVTPEDTKVAEQANFKVKEYCGDKPDMDVDRSEGREELLKAAGGENIILNVLTKAKDPSEIPGVLQEEAIPSLFYKVAPLAMAFVMLFLWLICCWTACPCCKCCRCAKERHTSLALKIIALFLIIGLAGGILISAGLAIKGYNTAVDGFDNVACSSAEFLNITLSGQVSPPFLGMIPLLGKFNELDENLDNNSAFVNEISSILSRTEKITEAVGLASQTLDLLANMMQNDANTQPKTSSGADGFHTCVGCKDLSDALESARTALDEGIASALAGAREEVDAQLSPANRQDLQQSFRNSTSPLVQVTTTVREAFSFFVEDDGAFDRMRWFVDTWFYEIVLAIIFAAAILMVCGCSTVSCFTFREKATRREVGANPYNRSMYRCASCTWCCAFLYAIIAFLIGGLLYAISVPVSGTCLVMDDVNSQMLKDIAPAINLSTNSANFDMVADIIDNCFNPADPSKNANLMDILKVQGANGSNESVSMRTRMSEEMQDQIVKQFDEITATLTNLSVPGLVDSPEVVALTAFLAQNPMDAFILPDQARMSDDDRFKALSDGLEIAFGTSMSCSDFNSSDAALGNIPGIDSFEADLAAFGDLSNSSSTCAKSLLTCTDPGNNATCDAGSNYADLKQELLLSSQYRCDLFEDPGDSSQYCNPGNMTHSSGAWTNDCLDPVTRRATIKPRTCTLSEFVAYVQSFNATINRVLSRVDTTVPEVKDIINVDMRAAMDTFLLDPVTEIVDGVTCGFVATTYQELIDGLCYQGVNGFTTVARSYVACAALSCILLLLTFTLWCRGVNNFNAWEAKENERKALEKRPAVGSSV